MRQSAAKLILINKVRSETIENTYTNMEVSRVHLNVETEGNFLIELVIKKRN